MEKAEAVIETVEDIWDFRNRFHNDLVKTFEDILLKCPHFPEERELTSKLGALMGNLQFALDNLPPKPKDK